MEKDLAIAIDLGGTNTKVALATRSGKIVWKTDFATASFPDPEQWIRKSMGEVKKAPLLKKGDYRFVGLGLGAPNANYYSGVIAHAPNLPFEKGEIPIRALLKTITGLDCKITNDANASALGEKLFGGAKAMNDFFSITLGTGLGSGIFVQGKILYGSDGMAGEMGHTNLVPDGRLCNCGKKGCLETYVSASGLMKTYLEFSEPKRTAHSALQVYELAIEGHSPAKKAFQITAELLGKQLADMAALFSPEAIFLSGGLTKSGSLLYDATLKAFNSHAMKHHKNKIAIRASELPGQDAALLGAAALVWEE